MDLRGESLAVHGMFARRMIMELQHIVTDTVQFDGTAGIVVHLYGMPVVQDVQLTGLIMERNVRQVLFRGSSNIDRGLILAGAAGRIGRVEFAPVRGTLFAFIRPMWRMRCMFRIGFRGWGACTQEKYQDD